MTEVIATYSKSYRIESSVFSNN